MAGSTAAMRDPRRDEVTMKISMDDLVEALEHLSERDWQRVAGRFGGGADGDMSGDGKEHERVANDDRPAPSPRRLYPLPIRSRRNAEMLVVKIAIRINSQVGSRRTMGRPRR